MIFFSKKTKNQFGKNILTCFLILAFFVGVLPLHAQGIASPCLSLPTGGTLSSPSNFSDAICLIVGVLSALGPTVMGLTFLVFLWGLMRFVSSGGDEKRIQEGKDMMFWGVIGLFIMISIWAIIITLLSDFFGPGFSFGIPYLSTTP